MYVLVTCKNEKDRIKNSRENTETTFSPVYGDFFWRSRAAYSVVCGRIWPNFELIQALMYVIVTCKYEKDPIKNSRENMATPFSPLKPYGSYLLPWKPEFWSDLAQNLTQDFPHPNNASDKIWLQSAPWS